MKTLKKSGKKINVIKEKGRRVERNKMEETGEDYENHVKGGGQETVD